MASKQHRRGEYGELLREEYYRLEKKGSKWIYYDREGNILNARQIPVIKAFDKVDKIMSKLSTDTDSHGWGYIGKAEFDKKGRGSAINWDLYGFGKDVHDKGFLAVIQVREYAKRTANGWGSVRKNYFLIGTNEDKTVFAHPVESKVVHAAIKKGKDVILSVQNWIFGDDYRKLVRQGDVAFREVPMIIVPGEKRDFALLMQSHKIVGDIREDGKKLYVRNARATHETHPDIYIGPEWRKVVVGRRAKFWKFTEPTAD